MSYYFWLGVLTGSVVAIICKELVRYLKKKHAKNKEIKEARLDQEAFDKHLRAKIEHLQKIDKKDSDKEE